MTPEPKQNIKLCGKTCTCTCRLCTCRLARHLFALDFGYRKTEMNRDALAYLQVGRAALSHKQTLSRTMHVLLRKLPSNAKFLLKTTLVIVATTPRPLSHAHPNFKLADCRTTMQKHCGTSKMLQVGYSYTPRTGCCWGNIHVQICMC